MPLPNTNDVGEIIDFLKKDKPGMSKKQRTAIALNQSRKKSKGKRKEALEEYYKDWKQNKK